MHLSKVTFVTNIENLFIPIQFQLPIGQDCIKHYQKMKRVTVFSHDELLFKMASIPDLLELDLAKKLYDCMQGVVSREIETRRNMNTMVCLSVFF